MGNLISKQILVRDQETEGNEPDRPLTETEQSINSKNWKVAEPSAGNEKKLSSQIMKKIICLVVRKKN